MNKPLLIHITSAPTPDCEALEYALAMAAFDLDVRLLFSGAGLGWLVQGQSSRKPDGKNPAKLLSALPMYGIDELGYLTDDRFCGIEIVQATLLPADHDWFHGRQTVSF